MDYKVIWAVKTLTMTVTIVLTNTRHQRLEYMHNKEGQG